MHACATIVISGVHVAATLEQNLHRAHIAVSGELAQPASCLIVVVAQFRAVVNQELCHLIVALTDTVSQGRTTPAVFAVHVGSSLDERLSH